MKKFISILLVAITLSASVFANFFSNRIFEIVIDTPVEISNNTFAVLDYLKDELVIDLEEMANSMPQNGFNMSVNVNPSIATNLHIKNFDVGIKVGANVNGFASISKDLFNFICVGNELGEALNVSTAATGDVFAYAEALVGFKVRKLKVQLRPAVFSPLIHVFSDDAIVSIQNPAEGDDAGSLIFDLSGSANFYSIYNFTDEIVAADVLKSLGFDIGGSLSYDIFKNLKVTGSANIPLVPGHIYNGCTRTFGMHYKNNIPTLMSGETAQEYDEFYISDPEWEEVDYTINRPFKLNAQVDFTMMAKLIGLSAGAGIGVRNPFSEIKEEILTYPEYYFAAQVNVFDVLRAKLSSEYTDQIFIQKLQFNANVRVFELDLGVSTQSSNFASSFKAAGLGAYITVVMGF